MSKKYRIFAAYFIKKQHNMENNKHQRFNHQYAHCRAENCDCKDDCVNYLAYLEAIEFGLKDIKVVPHCKNEAIDYVRVRIEK